MSGYISPDLIKAGGAAWVRAWMQKAIEAEKMGNELVVTEVKPGHIGTLTTSENANDETFIEPFI